MDLIITLFVLKVSSIKKNNSKYCNALSRKTNAAGFYLKNSSNAIPNWGDISNAIEIPYAMLNRYVDLLQTTYLISLIMAWFSDLGLRLVKAPRRLINQCGFLASHLAMNASRFERDWGLFIIEHWRVTRWISTLRRKGGDIIGIDLKASITVKPDNLKGLKQLAEATKKKLQRGIVLYGGDEFLPLGEKFVALPMSALWS